MHFSSCSSDFNFHYSLLCTINLHVFLSLIRQGHLTMVIQLMRYGADPTISDGEGYRALHLAILFQHMAIAAYLMAKGQVRLLTRCYYLSLSNTFSRFNFFISHCMHASSSLYFPR